MSLKFIQVVECINRSFLFIAELCSTGWIYHSLFIQSLMEDLGIFLLLLIPNIAAINTCAWVFVWLYIFTSLGEIPRVGTAESHGNSMFNFIRSCQTVFQSAYTIRHSPPVMCEWPCLSALDNCVTFAILICVCCGTSSWFLLPFPNRQQCPFHMFIQYMHIFFVNVLFKCFVNF